MYVKLSPFKKSRRIGQLRSAQDVGFATLSIPALAYMRMCI
jgi:hypothetical protein